MAFDFLKTEPEFLMGPKTAATIELDLSRMELVNLIDPRHELVRLAVLIDWQAFSDEWRPQFTSTTSRPALPTRLMVALLYLKHLYALSDEDLVERWCENPYLQHFSSERYFRHDLLFDPSSLVRWRQRIGEEGCEWLLAQSIEAAKAGGVMAQALADKLAHRLHGRKGARTRRSCTPCMPAWPRARRARPASSG